MFFITWWKNRKALKKARIAEKAQNEFRVGYILKHGLNMERDTSFIRSISGLIVTKYIDEFKLIEAASQDTYISEKITGSDIPHLGLEIYNSLSESYKQILMIYLPSDDEIQKYIFRLIHPLTVEIININQKKLNKMKGSRVVV